MLQEYKTTVTGITYNDGDDDDNYDANKVGDYLSCHSKELKKIM